MKKINWDPRRLELAKHSFIKRGKYPELLSKGYGRKGFLKVFDLIPIKSVDEFYSIKWGDDPSKGEPRKNTTLWEATQIQNILAWHGLAFKVYGLEAVALANKIYPAQFIQYVEDYVKTTPEEVEFIVDKCIELGKQYGFSLESRKLSKDDVIDHKLVDIQMFAFNKPYEKTVKFLYEANKYGQSYYQNLPELMLSAGPRQSEDRIKQLGLNKIDFKDKRVLDVGCSGGFFTRYVVDRGAMFGDGIDLTSQVEVSRHVANLFGYFNNMYYDFDVTKDIWTTQSYDIVFFFSMNYHVGIPQQILDSRMVVFEDNGKDTRHVEKLEKPWIDYFSKIEYIGRAKDHGDKVIFHLYK